MKKTILFISLIIAISANAQFVGNFYHADPNAVFDKEPYFACLNNYTYMGYGQNIQNIIVVINDEYVYSYPYIWNYGYWLVLGNENGFEFSSGDNVKLYWGNSFIGSWTYSRSYNYPRIPRTPKGNAVKFLKQSWKYVKKLL